MGEAVQLRRRDFEDIQAHVDLAVDLFAAHGLTLGTSGDMEAFAAYISGEKHSWGASASHNPLNSYLTPANAFWVYLEDRETGVKIASCTQKVVWTESFIADIFSHTLYDTQNPVLDGRLPEFYEGAEEADFAFSGNVVYGSGLYIHPDYRGKGLIILSRLSRTIALRHFKAHHFVGIQRLTERSAFHALERQCFAHCKPFVKGMPYKWDGSFQISWSSRAEWLEAIRRELQDAGRYRRGPLHYPDDCRAAEAISDNRA